MFQPWNQEAGYNKAEERKKEKGKNTFLIFPKFRLFIKQQYFMTFYGLKYFWRSAN